MTVLMTLGEIRFSMEEGSYRQLSQTLEIRVARMDRAGGSPAAKCWAKRRPSTLKAFAIRANAMPWIAWIALWPPPAPISPRC